MIKRVILEKKIIKKHLVEKLDRVRNGWLAKVFKFKLNFKYFNKTDDWCA